MCILSLNVKYIWLFHKYLFIFATSYYSVKGSSVHVLQKNTFRII